MTFSPIERELLEGRTRHVNDAEILWLISLDFHKETRGEMFYLLATNNSGYLANNQNKMRLAAA